VGDGQSQSDSTAAGVAEALEGLEEAAVVGCRDARTMVDYS
jgi:hypothetical protein